MPALPPSLINTINRALPIGLWLIAIALPLLGLWLGLQPPALPEPAAAATQATAQPEQTWPQLDLFHRQAQPGNAQPGVQGWTLHGIQHAGVQPSAIIADAQGQQRSVVEGGALAPGWQLLSVHADTVSLQGPQGMQQLQLPRRARLLAPTQPAAPIHSQPATTHAPAPAPVAATAATTATAPRLQAGTPAALWLARHGLRPGDELLSLDGQPLGSADARELQQQLRDRERVQLQWRRDGQTHSTALRIP